MSEELKPCPFCGGEAELCQGYDEDGTELCSIHCGTCGMETIRDDRKPAEAITAWNTRPSPWISVTPETMPERKQSVFVTNGKTVKEVRELFASDDDGVITVGASWEFDEAITHWMPIPELPT